MAMKVAETCFRAQLKALCPSNCGPIANAIRQAQAIAEKPLSGNPAASALMTNTIAADEYTSHMYGNSATDLRS